MSKYGDETEAWYFFLGLQVISNQTSVFQPDIP